MSNNTDSNKYTILFAIGMVVVVGSLLAFTASSLKPNIVENERMEKQQNILYAMGVNENGATDIVFVGTDKVADEFSKYIAKQLIVDASGNAVENNEAYLIDVKKEQAKAKNGQKRDLPLFVGQKAGQTYYIAPIRGKGLWDAIWGMWLWMRTWLSKVLILTTRGKLLDLEQTLSNAILWMILMERNYLLHLENSKELQLLKAIMTPKILSKTITRLMHSLEQPLQGTVFQQ